jgi:rhomboid protease GluP
MAKCTQCGRELPALSLTRICQWCKRHQAAQRGEEPADALQPVMTAPWRARASSSRLVTQLFFGANVAVFLGMCLAGISPFEPTGQELVRWGANWGPLTVSGEWWRLLTSAFVHIGIIHIGLNMWCLWSLGTMAESLLGPWTFAGVYLISGLAGSLTSVAWHPGIVSAGASGAIFGIAGALISAYYLGEFSASRAQVAGSLRSVLMFAGYNLVYGAMSGVTDNAAHIGGLVAGLVLGALIARLAGDRSAVVGHLFVLLLGMGLVAGGIFLLQHERAYLVHYQRGNALLEDHKFGEAVAEFQTAIRQRHDFVPAHLQLADAYRHLQRYAEAEAVLQRIITAQPRDLAAPYDLGLLYLEEGRLPQAQEQFAGMLKRDAKAADAHFGLGLVLAAGNDHQAAIQEFNAAANMDGDLEGVFYELGRSYVQLKMYDEAIAAFRKAQETSGDNADTESFLAAVYQTKGMTQQAEAARRKAAELKEKR